MDTLYKRMRIVDIRTETPHAKTFVLAPLDGWLPNYHAGQFLTLVFNIGQEEKRRSFSISSCPALHEPLAITVKKLDNGEFSRILLYKANKGDVLYCSGIGGFFILPASPGSMDYCFLAAGSGITPIYPLIKTLLHTTTAPIVLVYSNRTKEETIFYDALQTLADLNPGRLQVRYLFSSLFDVHHSRLSNWLLTNLLDEYFPAGRTNTRCYVCGPFDYMQMVVITLRTNGIPAQHIIREDFDPLPRPTIRRPPDVQAHQVTLHINGSVHQLTVQYPQTITQAARAAGIQLPYSCEAGRCGSCVANLVSGKIWMAYNEVLMDEEIAKGRVLTCVGFPVDGDVVVEYV